MVGVKGRSGRADTPEKRNLKAEAGRAGIRSREAKNAAPNIPRLGGDDLRDRPELAAGAVMSLADYDAQIGLPVSWADAIKREQLMGEKIINETKQIEMDKMKGKLFTEKQVTERDDAWNSAVAAEAEKVQRLIDSVDGITPEQRKAFLEHFREWRKQLGQALSTCR